MDNNSDIINMDISKSIDVPPAPPRNARRRRDSQTQSNGNATAVQDTSPFTSILSSPASNVSRSRRFATWNSDDNTQMEKNKLKSAKNRTNINDDDNDVIPMIPDIEDVRDQEFVQQTANAPAVRVNRLINFQDLDKDSLKHAAFASFEGIDLRQLTDFCLHESQLKEDDIQWNWDNLISDVTSKLIKDNESEG